MSKAEEHYKEGFHLEKEVESLFFGLSKKQSNIFYYDYKCGSFFVNLGCELESKFVILLKRILSVISALG